MFKILSFLLLYTYISLAQSKEFLHSLSLPKTKTNESPLEIIQNIPIEEYVFVVSKFCTRFKPSSKNIPSFVAPDPQKLNFILLTKTKQVTVPIFELQKLLNDKEFNKTWPTVLYSSGYGTDYSLFPSYVNSSVSVAFLNRSNVNFILLDPYHYIDPLYVWASYNCELIGGYVGKALAQVTDIYPNNNFHLIGLSLGAHILGAASRTYYKTTGTMISHITGLEPALPCFRHKDVLMHLSKSDAKFVDIFHSDSGQLGTLEPVGHVDFYPNGLDEIQPGCNNGLFDPICSHIRSEKLYAESATIGYEHDFPAVHCKNFNELANKNCSGNTVYMGLIVPHHARGIYYMKTSASFPFGRHSN